MAVRESVEIDLDRVDRLIQEQEAELEPKHRASIAYREIARRHVAGGVASSWQASHRTRSSSSAATAAASGTSTATSTSTTTSVTGAMVVGHAHPAIVEAIERQVRNGTHFAQPTKHLDAIGANLAERFSLPLWRFCNSGTEATLEARG
jgi:glutamate-1-semialdehyde 2,1-aminomutase